MNSTNYIKRQKRERKELFLKILLWLGIICGIVVLCITCKAQLDMDTRISNSRTQYQIDSLINRTQQYELRLRRYDYIIDLIEEMPDTECKRKVDSIIDNTE
jgi:vacuolar-type H+-ATPase subunit I/STV1